jgi:hypothetical protein
VGGFGAKIAMDESEKRSVAKVIAKLLSRLRGVKDYFILEYVPSCTLALGAWVAGSPFRWPCKCEKYNL